MFGRSERYLSILLSSSSLLASVAMILTAILLLKKGKIYNQFTRRLMIALLIVAFGITVYLVYLAFAFGNSYPSATPVSLQ
jgi:hypothetical protein